MPSEPSILMTPLARWLLGSDDERWVEDMPDEEFTACQQRAFELGLTTSQVDSEGRAELTHKGMKAVDGLVALATTPPAPQEAS